MAKSQLVQRRIVAWLLDVLLALGLGAVVGGLGWLVSTGYWLLRDGLFQGQSIGKRLNGLRVIKGADRLQCTFTASAVRNFLWVIPFVNLIMGLTGLYHLSKDRAGRHWGDRLADTRVVTV